MRLLDIRRFNWREPIRVTRGMVVGGGLLVGIAMAVVLVVVALIAVRINDLQQDEIRANRKANRENALAIARIRRLERPPTREQLTQAALDALRAIRLCARSAECRRRNPGVTQIARSIPRGEIPRRAPRTRRRPGGDSSRGGGGGSTGPGSSPSPPPSSPGPSQTGSTPQPTVRPRQPPARRPADRPQTAPDAPSAPGPTPRPGVTTPPVTVPPTPATPPITVPPITTPPIPVPPLCTPVIQVNCRRPNGRLVGPTGAAADPDSNSGRGNQREPLCERTEAPCPLPPVPPTSTAPRPNESTTGTPLSPPSTSGSRCSQRSMCASAGSTPRS